MFYLFGLFYFVDKAKAILICFRTEKAIFGFVDKGMATQTYTSTHVQMHRHTQTLIL